MQVVFHKIPIDDCWCMVASAHTCDNQSRRHRRDTHDQSRMARRRVSCLALITDDIAEMLKNATHFCL